MGVRFGRKPKLTKHQRDEALARIARGETLTAIARSYNVSHMTISRPAAVTFMQLDHAIFGPNTPALEFGRAILAEYGNLLSVEPE